MLEVSDQETVQQKDFKTAYVSIPVQIGPKIPLLRCPELHGRRSTPEACPAPSTSPPCATPGCPIGMTLDDVVFESTGSPSPRVSTSPGAARATGWSSSRPTTDAPSSINGRLVVKARGGPESAIAVLGRSASTVGQVDANGNPLPTLGPPRLRPFSISGLKAGLVAAPSTCTSYLDSPLEKPRSARSRRPTVAGRVGPDGDATPGAT